MNRCCLQFFFAALIFSFPFKAEAALEQGKSYPITMTDAEGRRFSLADGRATLLTVATRDNEPRAHLVGNNVPDQFIGHPHYRCVTVINFQNRIPSLLRRIISAVVRRRFRAEANAVQPRYAARKISHSPRLDLFAVADFDGAVVRRLGIEPTSNEFAVFVFDGYGRLLQQWREVPSREDLRAALLGAP